MTTHTDAAELADKIDPRKPHVVCHTKGINEAADLMLVERWDLIAASDLLRTLSIKDEEIAGLVRRLLSWYDASGDDIHEEAAAALSSLSARLRLERRMALEEAAKALPIIMQEEWSDICSDTDCHPLDIQHRGRTLFYSESHWTEAIQRRLRSLPPSPDIEAMVERGARALAESPVEPRPNNETKVRDWLNSRDLRNAARAVLTAIVGK